jgi:hypothetical protein
VILAHLGGRGACFVDALLFSQDVGLEAAQLQRRRRRFAVRGTYACFNLRAVESMCGAEKALTLSLRVVSLLLNSK